jgi:hypothetical protein
MVGRATEKLFVEALANPELGEIALAATGQTFAEFESDARHAFTSQMIGGIPRVLLYDFEKPADHFGSEELHEVMAGYVAGKRASPETFGRLLAAVRANESLSNELLPHLAWFTETFTNEAATLELHTAAAGLLLCLSPGTLQGLDLSSADVDWLTCQAFMLLGRFTTHLNEKLDAERASCKSDEDLAELFKRAGKVLIDDDSGPGRLIAARLLASIEMLKRHAQENERRYLAKAMKLARLEERLQNAFPQESISFEDENIDELLAVFEAPTLQNKNGAPSLRWQAEAPTASSTTSTALSTTSAVPDSASSAMPDDCANEEEEFSMETLRAQWNALKLAKAQKERAQRAAAGAVPRAAAIEKSTAESKQPNRAQRRQAARSAKQSGAKSAQSHSGYEHLHPGELKALPKAVAKNRIAALIERTREGRKYTADDRARYRQMKPEVAD